MSLLDGERRLAGSPLNQDGLVRDWSPDNSICRIVFSTVATADLKNTIEREKNISRAEGYTLEWKTFEHDMSWQYSGILTEAGFEGGDVETVLAIEIDDHIVRLAKQPRCEIRKIANEAELEDVITISTKIGRPNAEVELRQLTALLRVPERASIYVAYVDGEPVSTGRIHYGNSADFAELAGGRTVPAQRRKGFFTALVMARLKEALTRNKHYIFVDALDTSKTTLTKLGFRTVTRTQPFTYAPVTCR